MRAPTPAPAWDGGRTAPIVPTTRAPGLSADTLDLPRWSPAALEAAATSCAALAAALSAIATDEAGRAVADDRDWSGPAAEVAAGVTRQRAARIRSIAERLDRLALAVGVAAEQAAVVAALVDQAELAALAEADDGAPASRVLGSSRGTAPGGSAVLAAHARAVADAADGDLARVLRQVLGEGLGLTEVVPATAASAAFATSALATSALATSAIATPATPGGYAATWAGLGPQGRLAAIAGQPELVGATDGIPGWARDRANRLLLDRAEASLTAQVAALAPPPRTIAEQLGVGGTLTVGTFGGGTTRVAYRQAVDELAAIRSTRAVLAQRDGQVRQLLVFDVSGRQATVAVAVGDVDTADHVAVLVDGFTTTVAHDLAGADALATDLAVVSRRAAMGWGDRGQVAVVTWLGYDTPQTDDTLHSQHSVVLAAGAKAGAAALTPFLTGLDHGQHLTLVGHSYGSTVAGLAVAQGGTGVDDLVVMGSPGLGTSDPRRIGIPADRVHVLEAKDDPVADLGWFGTDPSWLTGIDRLSTEALPLPDGRTGAQSVGHSAYLAPGTTSQWSVAAVVSGTPPPR